MSETTADSLYFNGKVITVDAGFRICSAIATRGDRIVAVGDDAALRPLAGPLTRCIDLRGKAVIPGLIDAHAHMDREGLRSVYPSLAGARSVAEILGRIEKLAKAARPGEWIVTMPIGNPPSYWNVPDSLDEKRWPTRRELDEVAPDNPVYIKPIWGYWRHKLPLVSIANSRALELCGIDGNTTLPVTTVEIEKDGNGELTGRFIENTYTSVVEMTLMRPAGGFSLPDRVAGLERSMAIYNSFGTTSVFEGHGVAAEVLAAYRTLAERQALTVRANLLFSPSWNAAQGGSPAELLTSWGGWLGGRGLGDNMLRVAGLYALVNNEGPQADAENRLRSSAGAYTGWAGFYYDAGLPRDRLKQVLVAAARQEIRCCGLCIAPDLLDLYEEVDRIVPIRDRRWILAHLNFMNADEIARVRDLGLVVTTHTNRIWRAGSQLLAKADGRGADELSPLADLREARVRFCLASDNAPVSLFNAIWQAVARIDRATGQVIGPRQKISREDALRAATINGAYLTCEEHDKGSIEPGKLADFVCLTHDPLTVAEDELMNVEAEFTVVGGRIVHGAAAAVPSP